MFLIMHIGNIRLLAEKINRQLKVIKMIEREKLLKVKIYLWYYHISKVMKKILKYVPNGIKEFQEIREKKGYIQLQLKL